MLGVELASLAKPRTSRGIEPDPLATLTDFLRDKTTLIVLDSYEHTLVESAKVRCHLLPVRVAPDAILLRLAIVDNDSLLIEIQALQTHPKSFHDGVIGYVGMARFVIADKRLSPMSVRFFCGLRVVFEGNTSRVFSRKVGGRLSILCASLCPLTWHFTRLYLHPRDFLL